MPYYNDPNLEQDPNKDQTNTPISGAAPTTDSSGSVAAPNQKGLQTGSGYQNLDKYLQTNSNNGFGGQLGQKVQGQVDMAKQGIQAGADQFNSQVSSANKIPAQSDVNSAIANPTGANASDFQNWENQSYSGPNSLADSASAWNKVNSGISTAGTQAQLLGTEPGRFTLLDSYFGRPNYSFGQKSLDNALVQNAGVGGQTQAIQNQATALKAQGSQVSKDAQNTAAQRAGEVEQSAQGVRNAIGIDQNGQVVTGDKAGAIGKEEAAATQALTDQNAQRQAAVKAIQSGAGSNYFDADQLTQLGLSAGDHPYNLNLNDYIKSNPDLTLDQSLSPDQRARIQALDSLAGISDPFAQGSPLAATDPFTFDKAGFQNASSKVGQEYNNKVSSLLAQGFPGKQISPQEFQFELQDLRQRASDPNDPYRGSAAERLKTFEPIATQLAALDKTYNSNGTLNSQPLASIPSKIGRRI